MAMFLLAVAIGYIFALAQASNVLVPRQLSGNTTATETPLAACCYLYVNAAVVVKYVTEVKNVVTVTIIKEIHVTGSATYIQTFTRTRTVLNPSPTNLPGESLPYVSETGSAFTTEITALPITTSAAEPDPIGQEYQAPPKITGGELLVYDAPQFAGVSGQPTCGSIVTPRLYKSGYTAQTTLVSSVSSYGGSQFVVSVEDKWFQYNAASVKGKVTVLANPSQFPGAPLFPTSAINGQTAKLDPNFVQYLARVPGILTQYPDIAKCTAGDVSIQSALVPVTASESTVTTEITSTVTAEYAASGAPYRNTTSTYIGPTATRQWNRTSTVWINPTNILVFTGDATTQQLRPTALLVLTCIMGLMAVVLN